MRVRERVALAGVVAMVGTLLAGPALVLPADAVTQVVAAPKKPDKADRKPGGKADKRADNKPDRKPRKPKDRTPPPTPVLGDPGVGAGGRVSLPIIAASGAYVVVAELGGGVVATGTGVGGYSSLAWTTSHGVHSYLVTASDRARNRSGAAQVSVVVDALPPRLGGIALSPGTPSDTRSRLVFGTNRGSAYRILADGRQVASGITSRPRTERFLDLADGRHRVQVVVRDSTGNARSATRPVVVRIPELAVSSRLASDPTTRKQAVRVRATPTATRGVLRVPGRSPVAFVMRRGSATVTLSLKDGTYPQGTVSVRDTRGRKGRTRVPDVTVDTSPPVLDVAPDQDAAADGSLRAAVTAEDGVDVRWRLVDSDGDVVTSGVVDPQDGEGTIASDVEKGTYRLVVAATDAFDRTTTVRTISRVADDAWPVWLVVLVGTVLTLGAAPAVAGLVLLVRWARRPDSPVRPVLAAARRTAERRLRALRGPAPEVVAPGAEVTLFAPDGPGPRVPLPRSPSRAGGAFPPGDGVVHRTPVRVYETTEERDDGPVLGSRTAELVLAGEGIALVDDRTGDIWSGQVAAVAHLRDDTTLVLPAGEHGWIGLVYTDPELTRSVLDRVAADQAERRLAPAGTTGDG